MFQLFRVCDPLYLVYKPSLAATQYCHGYYSPLNASNSSRVSENIPVRKVLIQKINALVWFPGMKKKNHLR